jgi:RNA ligase (TIGR02306 family)
MSDLNKVEVVPFEMTPHFNADSLSVVRVFDGYNCVVRTCDWEGVTKAAFSPPDNIVPDRPEFAFLQGKNRIKAKKLRGVVSQGLLVPVPDHFNIGDDVTEYFGVVRYDPETSNPTKTNPANFIAGPVSGGVKYDLESWFKYRRLIPDGTEVSVTEKIHGASAKYTYQDGEFWVSSRNFYRKESDDDMWWQILRSNQWLMHLCAFNEGVIFHGEVYGWVADLRYGHLQGMRSFRIFDAWKDGQFIDRSRFLYIVPPDYQVPELWRGPHSIEKIEELIDGKSVLGGNIREGVVIKPVKEMYDNRVGRLCLKAVSPSYLERS